MQIEKDILFDQALKFAKEKGVVSSSKLQIEFRIGYHRADKIIFQLDHFGFLNPEKSTDYKNRTVK